MSDNVYLGYKASTLGAAVAGGIVAAALTQGPPGKRVLAAMAGLLAMFVGTDIGVAGLQAVGLSWLASERLVAVLLAIGGLVVIETWHRLLTRVAHRVDDIADHMVDHHIGPDPDKPA